MFFYFKRRLNSPPSFCIVFFPPLNSNGRKGVSYRYGTTGHRVTW
uniref:Uncharacterized protein n=1 Tax=Anguilla anguilla TaxID=7936 RepID=A0A0E9WRT3_ANGAN